MNNLMRQIVIMYLSFLELNSIGIVSLSYMSQDLIYISSAPEKPITNAVLWEYQEAFFLKRFFNGDYL